MGEKYTDQHLIDNLITVSKRMGYTPKMLEFDTCSTIHSSVYVLRFEKWNNAVKRAKLEQRQPSQSYLDSEILSEIKRVYSENKDAKTATELLENSRISKWPINKRFGSIHNVLKILNLPPLSERRRGYKEKKRPGLIEDYKRITEELGRIPKVEDVQRLSKFKLWEYREHWSSFKNLAIECGFINSKPKISKEDLVEEINKPNLMDRKKPWNGPIDFPKTKNISNDIEELYANDLIIWKGNKLNKKYLRSINEDERDEVAKDLLNFFEEFDFIKDFKYRESEIIKGFENLKERKSELIIEDGVKYVKNSGTNGYKVYRHYFPNIAKIRGEKRKSVYDVLTSKDMLWATIRNRIGNTLLYGNEQNKDIGYRQFPMPITPNQLCIGAKNSGLASMASIFKPHVAKTIYSNWVKDGDVILDYSAGFGGRLLGLMSLGIDVKYLAYEPCSEIYENLIKMINYFGFNAEIKKCGSEETLFNDKVNFAFSSPPYFNLEQYCEEDSQCYLKYPDYNEWLEKYWRKTVTNIKEMLVDDGVFAVNVGGKANDVVKKIEKDFRGIICEEGFSLVDEWYMKTSRSHLAAKKDNEEKKFKLEGIFFYKKG